MSQSIDVAAHHGLYLPDEPASLYNLCALPDPPQHWEILGHSFSEVQGIQLTTLRILQTLARAHLWGIQYHDGRPVTIHDIQTSLWKLLYYQRDELRPQSWSDLFNWGRDTGPRLLRYTLDPRPDPVSRFYPNMPTIGLGLQAAQSSFQRPDDAPDSVLNEIVEQFLFGLWKDEAALSPRVGVNRDIDKGDGTWVYIKAPKELPSPECVSMEDVSRSITASGAVGESDIETAEPHSPNGWVARLRSRELAWSMRRSRLEISGFTTHAILFKPEGARIFFCSDYGWATIWGYLLQGLLQMKEIRECGIRFWVGAHNPSLHGQHQALLVFESPLAFSDLEIPIPGPSACIARFQGGRESDRESMTKFLTEQCSICHQAHPDRPIQHCPQLNTLWTDTSEGSELLLPAPPNYFYFR